MPNWCMNRITVEGPHYDVVGFINKLMEENVEKDRERGSFSIIDTFLPMPDDVIDWREWAMEHWGCKWADECSMFEYVAGDDGTTSVRLTGSTPWGPPLEALLGISKMLTTLTFTISYREDGMCFGGAVRFKAGKYKVSEIGPDEWPDYAGEEEEYSEYEEKVEALIERALQRVSE